MQCIVDAFIKNSPASSSLKDSIAWSGLFLKEVSSAKLHLFDQKYIKII